MPDRRSAQRSSDIKLLLGAAVGIILGGIVIAAAILAITSRGKGPNLNRPVSFGIEASIHRTVRAGGPINMAGLSGDDGFWLAIEDHRLVPLLVKQPSPESCTLRWRGSKNTFTCDDRPVSSEEMARFRSFTSKQGTTEGSLMVDLRKVLPAPAQSSTAGG